MSQQQQQRPKESLVNKDLVLPDDLYMLVFWTVAWGVTHAIFKRLIVPVATYCVGPQPKEVQESSSKAAALKDDDKPPSGNLRKRKTGAASSTEKKTAAPATPKAKKPVNNVVKFSVSAWKFFNFTSVVILGVYTLSQEYWTFLPEYYLKGWPENHHMSRLMNLYYSVSFGSCAFMLISVFLDPKQKDFVVMLIHHVTTLVVIFASYIVGFFRIGAVILLLHDVSDPFMEIAKCFVYSGKQKMADLFFLMFAVVFLFTRNFLFPFYVIHSIPTYGYHSDGRVVPFGRFEVNWLCLGCLCILEVLHIYWAYLIIKMAIKALLENKVEGDIRDEEDD